MQREKLGMF